MRVLYFSNKTTEVEYGIIIEALWIQIEKSTIFGLHSSEFLFLLVQKQKSGFKLANCDSQINFVFLQITLNQMNQNIPSVRI